MDYTRQLMNAGRLAPGMVVVQIPDGTPVRVAVERITGRAGRYRDPANKPVRIHCDNGAYIDLCQLDPVHVLV